MNKREIASKNLSLALWLVRKDFYVIPVQGGGEGQKTPMPGLSWKKASTKDEKIIQKWWKDPECTFMPAIDCGKSGILVLDADVHRSECAEPDGVANFFELFKGLGLEPNDFFLVNTPSGGYHIYFLNTINHGNGRGALPPKIDVRGNGGYIVAPGAVRQDGKKYKVIEMKDIVSLPKDLALILTNTKSSDLVIHNFAEEPKPKFDVEGKKENAFVALSSSVPGTRNDTLFKSACEIVRYLNSGGLDRGAMDSLKSLALSKGLNGKEIAATILSAYKEVGQEGFTIYNSDPILRVSEERANNLKLVNENESVSSFFVSGGTYEPSKEFMQVIENWYRPDLINSYPPGILGKFCRLLESTAYIHQPQLFIAASLALGSAMIGRGVENYNGGNNNLFICSISATGTGKNHPQVFLKKILEETALNASKVKTLDGSYEYFVDSLDKNPLQVIITDEYGRMYKKSISSSTSESKVFITLVELWSFVYRFYLQGTKKNEGAPPIEYPYITVLGSGTTEQIFENMTEEEIQNGTINRHLFFLGDDTARTTPRGGEREVSKILDYKEEDTNPTVAPPSFPPFVSHSYLELKHEINVFCDILDISERVQKKYKCLLKVGFYDSALALFNKLSFQLDTVRIKKAKEKDVIPRVVENAMRVATILAVTNAPQEKLIKREVFVTHKDAWRAINYCLNSAIVVMQQITLHGSSSSFERDSNFVLNKIRLMTIESEKGFITKTELCRATRSKFQSKYMEEVLKVLQEAEAITLVGVDSSKGGRPQTRIYYGKYV